MNMLRTTVLLAALTALLVFGGELIGGTLGALVAFVFAGGMNFFSYWYSDRMVISMYHGKEISQKENSELYGLVQRLAESADIPIPKIFVLPQETPNAFATGRNPEHAAVAVTHGIINILNKKELAGVIAHELAHIKNRDILISTIAATLAGAISYLAMVAQWAMIFGGGHDRERGGGNIIGLIVMMIVAPIAAMVIQMAVSRSREYAADEGGAKICKDPLALASGLRKLQIASERVPLQVNEATAEATAHMFIVNPLSGGGLRSLFSTHPPLEERISRLEVLASNMKLKRT